MPENWIDSPDGRQRIKDLLRHVGMPLEVGVTGLCREFCRRHNGERQTRIDTLRAVYDGLRPGRAAREVDQSVQFSRYVDVDEHLGVRLRLRVPIECKHRHGLSVFGFPRPSDERIASLPMVSDFAGAILLNQFAYIEPTIVSGPSCAVTLLNVEKSHPHSENLIENAGAGLYDFVRAVEARANRGKVDDLIERFGLLESFGNFCAPSGDWFAHFRRFVRTLSASDFDNFNREWTQGKKLYLEVSLHVPVVCFDAPLFLVQCETDGSISSFVPVHTLTTGLRLKGWPGRMSFDLGRRSPEALVLVSDVKGLGEILGSCLEWYVEMLDELERSGGTVVRRALLEGALFRSTAAANELRKRRRTGRRSDDGVA